MRKHDVGSRAVVAASTALMLLLVGGCRADQAQPGAARAVAAPAARLVSPESAVAALAASGVATMPDLTSTTPVVPVTGAQVLAVTTWQATNMAREASVRGGILGADLDRALPMPGPVRMSDVLGAWAINSADPAERTANELLGPVDWHHSEDVVFPTEVLTLFVADALQHIATAAPAAANPSTTATATSAVLSPNASGSSATVQPGAFIVGRQMSTTHETPILTAPCSTISAFFNGVLSQVFNALKLDPATVADWVSGKLGGGAVGAVVGGLAAFAASFWNHLVDVVRTTTLDLLASLTQPVLDALRLAIGGIATFTMVLSYLKAWTAPVVADPPANRFAIGSESQRTGTFTVTVDTQAEVASWPPQLLDCASALGVPLPTLTRAGLPVSWNVNGTEPGLVVVDRPGSAPFIGALDDTLSNRLGYTTGRESTATAKGPLVSAMVTATVEVRRTEVEQLKNLVTGFLLGKVPGVLQPVVNPILQYYVGLAAAQLDHLIAVDGSATIVVSHHAPPMPTPTPSPPNCTPSGTAIPAGHFAGPIKATITQTMHLDLPGVNIPNAGGGAEGLSGRIDIASNGSTVTGSISLSGNGTSHVGLPGEPNVHSTDSGSVSGKISGPATEPVVNGTLSGTWASYDAPVINGQGSSSNTVRLGLHVTRADCSSVSGDAVALFREIAAPVAQYLTIGGSGTWTVPRVS